jgi:hypothetical protein
MSRPVAFIGSAPADLRRQSTAGASHGQPYSAIELSTGLRVGQAELARSGRCKSDPGRGNARLVASAASAVATPQVKRAQQSSGVSY